MRFSHEFIGFFIHRVNKKVESFKKIWNTKGYFFHYASVHRKKAGTQDDF